jgi:DNA-binding transcriptional ArsR family regulator
MGWLQDLLQEVPLSSVLKERVALAEDRFESAKQQIDAYKVKVAALEREVQTLHNEIQTLRAQLPAAGSYKNLGDDTTRVLVHIFRTPELEQRDAGAMALALGMERSVLQYHLDRLREAGLADT